MNQKNNLRFQEMDRKIREYFLSALSEREPDKITVQEICAHVGINRSSFYLHYRDVYDLLETMSHAAGKAVIWSLFCATCGATPFFTARIFRAWAWRA